jgi:hypothetical protein
MENHLGEDFSDVRVHTDERAAETAEMVGAQAYTIGRDIVLGKGQYAPATGPGNRLLAHELAHVVQQKHAATTEQLPIASPTDQAEREADVFADSVARRVSAVKPSMQLATQTLQRQTISGGGATTGTGSGIDLIFIIRAEDDQFTAKVTKYVQTVLKGQTYEEVDNLEEIVDKLAALQATSGQPGQQVRRIRIVAHGSTTGDVKMTPKGDTKRRWVTPKEVAAFASQPRVRSVAKSVMAPGAQVEFWGCNIGNVPEAGQAWSGVFGSEFRATTETFRTRSAEYFRPAGKDESGQEISGQRGRWVRITNSSEVDKHGTRLQNHFKAWLLGNYKQLVANGDIAPIKDEKEQVTYMRDLFDRSGGDIKHILVERKADKKEIRPGDKKTWMTLWQTFTVSP